MSEAHTNQRAAARVLLRPPAVEDADEFVALVMANRDFLHPWVDPPDTHDRFRAYIERSRGSDFRPLVLCLRPEQRIIGAINLSQIALANFCSAYVGFWLAREFSGQGLMGEALSELFRVAFGEMKLHRLEINVQPANEKCMKLLNRLHIRREGYSPRYLRVNGVWADHVRWAICAEDVRESW